MFSVRRQGIWIALGLSIGLHAIGLRFAQTLPREPASSSSIAFSLRLIEPLQEPIQYSTQTKDFKKIKSEILQSNEVSQTASRSVVKKPESVFARSIRYLDSNEIDTSSEPVSGWVLRLEELQSGGVIFIQLTLFIAADGKLDKFEILNSSLSQAETTFLLMDLALTSFKPAMKDGQPVPSQKNVEILLDPNPPIFRIPKLSNHFSHNRQ